LRLAPESTRAAKEAGLAMPCVDWFTERYAQALGPLAELTALQGFPTH
jgi:hypothetical protein